MAFHCLQLKLLNLSIRAFENLTSLWVSKFLLLFPFHALWSSKIEFSLFFTWTMISHFCVFALASPSVESVFQSPCVRMIFPQIPYQKSDSFSKHLILAAFCISLMAILTFPRYYCNYLNRYICGVYTVPGTVCQHPVPTLACKFR